MLDHARPAAAAPRRLGADSTCPARGLGRRGAGLRGSQDKAARGVRKGAREGGAAPRTDEQIAAGGELARVRARVHVLHDLGRTGGQQVVGAHVAALRGREAGAGAARPAQLPA